jgi:4'-phosphopantetheinyl transferase
MVEVYAVKLLLYEDFEFVRKQMIDFLPEKARERFARLSRGADVQRSLLGQLLARFLISERMKVSCKEIIFTTGPNGKPELLGNTDLHFNISHSGEWVVCALAPFPIGIDVERLRTVNPGLAERFFTPVEFASLQALQPDERTVKFIELWTLKESFLKAIGRGLTRNLNSFSVNPVGEIFVISGDDSSGEYYLKLFPVDTGYRMAVCAPTDDFCETVTKLEVDQLLNGLAKKNKIS